MKRVIMLGMMISCASFLSGMELSNNVALAYNIDGTNVTVIKQQLYRRPEREATTITVVGAYEQLSLQEPNLCDPGAIGDTNRVLPAVVYVKNDKFQYGEEIQWPKILVSVVEPNVVKLLNRWRYNPKRHTEEKDVFTDPVFMDERALLEAGNDLAVCYESVFNCAYKYFTEENQPKTIAFPPLSAFSQMPHENLASVAVSSIFFLIKQLHFQLRYKEIQFVVETDEDVNLYKKFLDEWTNFFHHKTK